MPKDEFFRMSPVVKITWTLLWELRLWESSRWYAYFLTLPRQHVPITMLWDERDVGGQDGEEALEWLKGSSWDEAHEDLVRNETTKVSRTKSWTWSP